jgi:peptidyl-prolyl cis-trans isomerase SurA
MSDEDMATKLNKKTKGSVLVSNEVVEKGKGSEAETLGWQAGQIYRSTIDTPIRLIRINEIIAPSPKQLSEVKGYAVSEYQDYLQSLWVAELRQKYPVVVNQDVFRSLIRTK